MQLSAMDLGVGHGLDLRHLQDEVADRSAASGTACESGPETFTETFTDLEKLT